MELAERRRTRRRHAPAPRDLGRVPARPWLPAKELTLAPSTHARHVTGASSTTCSLTSATPHFDASTDHFERFTAELLDRRAGAGGAHSEDHRRTSTRWSCVGARRCRRPRALLVANPAKIAHAPKRRHSPSSTTSSPVVDRPRAQDVPDVTAENRLLDAVPGRPPATGMRRGEVLGLRWNDVHFDTGRSRSPRPLISIGYQLEISRLKTRTSRRYDHPRRRRPWPCSPSGDDQQTRGPRVRPARQPRRSCVLSARTAQPLHPHAVSHAFEQLVATLGVADPVPRPPTHPRHPAAAKPGTDQGRLRAARSLELRRSR